MNNKHLIEKLNKYDIMVNSIHQIIFEVDINGKWVFLNNTWEKITGFSVKESLGKNCLDYILGSDKERLINNFKKLISGETTESTSEFRYPAQNDKGYIWVEICSKIIRNSNRDVSGACGIITDITNRKEMELELEAYREQLEQIISQRTKKLNETNEKLEYLATHDSLTGIPNRYLLEKVLDDKNNNMSALLFIDVDNFKIINDTFGHAVGDTVLIYIARKFKEILDPKHFIARLGGDEFAILLYNSSLDESQIISEGLRKSIDENELFIAEYNINISITISIGITLLGDEFGSQKFLSFADVALYAAKDGGKNRVEVIKSIDDKNRLSEMNNMVSIVKNALKYNDFILFFQPIFNMKNEVIHYESLIRMKYNGEIIYPNDFIYIAEKFGLMSNIDKWVIMKVISILKVNTTSKIFVNLSGISLGDIELLKFIEKQIIKNGILPGQIGFEITETTAIRDLELCEQWIFRLKKLGCQFSLDDFGMGFSSFSYLHQLPVDYLKIDGSFIKNLDKNPTQKALIEAMNSVAHTLGKKTIAEYIENEEVYKMLQDMNIDCGQGYFLGKPTNKF